MKLTRPTVTLGLAVLTMLIMCFPTWPLLYGRHTYMSIRWMSRFTTAYFEWEPLAAFLLTLVATCIVAYALPKRVATHVPSVLYFGAATCALIGRIDGTGWALGPAVVMVLLVGCAVLALKERPAEREPGPLRPS